MKIFYSYYYFTIIIIFNEIGKLDKNLTPLLNLIHFAVISNPSTYQD